ncbi:MAG: hypothetical protein JWN44_5958 [Myxococcales bacterium]|nr:hypothetical protein [Myxococcales bacterium]
MIRIVAVLVIIVASASCATRGHVVIGHPSEELSLKIESISKSYPLSSHMFTDGTVAFKATIQNGTRSRLALAATSIGTIEVIELLRDGIRVEPIEGWIKYYRSPGIIQIVSLQTLEPHASTTFTYSPLDWAPGSAMSVIYQYPPAPGHYRIRVAYQYGGGDNGRNNVFRGRLVSNDALFEVVE